MFNKFMKKTLILVSMMFLLLGLTSCKKFKNYTNEILNVKGDRIQQNVRGNLEGGRYTWSYTIKNDCIKHEDDLANFYDISSTTEVGDLFYFFTINKTGQDELTFTLKDNEKDEIYCELIYYVDVIDEKNLVVKTAVTKDRRPKELEGYTYDKVSVTFAGDEH